MSSFTKSGSCIKRVFSSYYCKRQNAVKMEKKEFDKGQVAGLNASIGYGEGAIVSRTILNKETGSVTLFSFDKGQSLSEHTAPFDALVQVLDGSAVIVLDKKPIEVKENEMIIMPANIPHAVEAENRFKMLLTMIKSK